MTSPRHQQTPDQPPPSEAAPAAGALTPTSGAAVAAREPAFAERRPSPAAAPMASLPGLFDVKVVLAVELGRTALEIGEVLKLGTGSVLELDRSVFEPVELLVQGVCIARGEVVV